ARHPGRSHEAWFRDRSRADQADGAVVEGQGAEVVDVGPARGNVAGHAAVLDRQRPESAVIEAAAGGPGGVARQGAVLDGDRATLVVEGAAAVAGRVAEEGTAADIQRSVLSVVEDGAAELGGVADEVAVPNRRQRVAAVEEAAPLAGKVVAGEVEAGGGVAG